MAAADSLFADYTALTTEDGSFELSEWSVVEMTGDDRLSFLHNMCTNDIRRLSPGDACEAFCTDVKGKIVAHLLVVAEENCLTLLLAAGKAESLVAHLDRYIIREDVTLADATSESTWVYFGEQAAAKTAAQANDAGPALHGEFAGLPGYFVRTNAAAPRRSCSFAAWEAVRIEAGFPLFGGDFDSDNLPQEVNRNPFAIHFNKGCYLGQETVARIDALGHVNRKLVLVQFAGETLPAVGEALQADSNVVGQVTSRCWSPHLQCPLALAMVRRGSNEPGSRLEGTEGTATVISPPQKVR